MGESLGTRAGRGRRWVVVLLALALLGFGIGCLNYTEASGLDQHAAMARRRGWPQPSRTIFAVGVACTVLGAGALGRASVRR